MTSTSPALVLAVAAVAAVVLRDRLSSKKRVPLPPGPPADPFIGHLRLVPSEGQDVFFYKLGKQYGDVVQLRVLGRSLIILNSVQAANDLLDKRSANYSDRPDLPIYELMGEGDMLGFVKYGDEFRAQRRMINGYFSQDKVKNHRPVQIREARILAYGLLQTPEKRSDVLSRFSTAIIVDVGYGHQIVSTNDPYVKIAGDVGRVMSESGPPGATLVDAFPILRYFPSWFPGTYYANYARNSQGVVRRLKEFPFNQVKEQIAQGTAKPSFLQAQLETMNQTGQRDETLAKRIQATAAVLYQGGADTTSAVLDFFFLAMLLYPQYQAKAHEEIDAVVGQERLPELHDRNSLPYLECLIYETLRWYQPAPTGGPHKSMEDDIYNGMLIPKGSILIPNIRGMTWDDNVYQDPFNFDPTRFMPAPMGRGEPYPPAFGFGRRVCPGRHLAIESLWLSVATIMATMTIHRTVDRDGKEVIPDVLPVTTGITSHPRPFQAILKPRTPNSFTLLKHAVESG
ncbi:putative cytochrome p450 [Lyophyllum shimeji]|uniref:Cytochrome p450 n=1 Tax=Lyophyllum shimeji TaxID=47721 RepID=A0A9P3Q0W8_LYOSH|nr:putative cytochrome p450 [Lyophyllum shimeji]